MTNVNGKLASLGKHGGFRRFIVKIAKHYNLTGSVQRTEKKNAEIVVFGTTSDTIAFDKVLEELKNQGFFQSSTPQELRVHRRGCGFAILPDRDFRFSDKNSEGIETGLFSGPEWELASVMSEDKGKGRKKKVEKEM